MLPQLEIKTFLVLRGEIEVKSQQSLRIKLRIPEDWWLYGCCSLVGRALAAQARCPGFSYLQLSAFHLLYLHLITSKMLLFLHIAQV